jgi:hypothetical protein
MLKKFLIVVGVLLVAMPGQASEVRKGSIELTGDLAFRYDSLSDDRGSYWDITSRAAFLRAITDTAQLGAGMRITYFNGDIGPISSADGGVASAEALLRFNFGSSPQVIPFLQFAIGIGNWYGDFYEDSNVTVSPSASLGMRYPFRDAVALNMTFSYVREMNYQGFEDVDANLFLLSFGFSIFPRGLGNR